MTAGQSWSAGTKAVNLTENERAETDLHCRSTVNEADSSRHSHGLIPFPGTFHEISK